MIKILVLVLVAAAPAVHVPTAQIQQKWMQHNSHLEITLQDYAVFAWFLSPTSLSTRYAMDGIPLVLYI